MASLDEFRRSYDESADYPCNLLHSPLFVGNRENFREKLHHHSTRLFRQRDPSSEKINPQVRIRFRDYEPVSQKAKFKENALHDDHVDEWLTNQSMLSDPGSCRDPRYRFIFFYSENSRQPLYTTIKSFQRIMSYHQVMPGHIDLLPALGKQMTIHEPALSGFCEQNYINGTNDESLNFLGRSSQHFQISYVLRSVVSYLPTMDYLQQQWTFRPVVVHHQYHQDEGTFLMMISSGHEDIYQGIQLMTSENKGRPQDRDFSTPEIRFKNSLKHHLYLAHWSLENWRIHVEWLTRKVGHDTDVIPYSNRSLLSQGDLYDDQTLSKLQLHLEMIEKVKTILQGNLEVVQSLRKFYNKLTQNKHFKFRKSHQADIAMFCTELQNIERSFSGEIKRALYLKTTVTGRKDLASQHFQGQTNRRMRLIANDGLDVAIDSRNQAITTTIIAIVTLLYLPATFASTFFSTDIVKYQGTEGNMGNFNLIAMLRWLQVTGPLTTITLLIAFAFWTVNQHKDKSHYSRDGFVNGMLPST